MSSILYEIADERRRQVQFEGFTVKHDDSHGDEQLLDAAVCYAQARHKNAEQPHEWPWESRWWKPKDRRRNLIRAAALIVAEIERIDRAAVLP